jgi:hypothetical protein
MGCSHPNKHIFCISLFSTADVHRNIAKNSTTKLDKFYYLERMTSVNGIRYSFKNLLFKMEPSSILLWKVCLVFQCEKKMFSYFQAANYLHIKTLLSVGCKAVANMVRGKSTTELREMFNITYLPPGESANNSTTNDDAGELAETAVSNDTAATIFETDSTNK